MARPFFFFGKRGVSVYGKHVGAYIEYGPRGPIRRAGSFWTKITWIAFLAFVGLLVYIEKFT